MTTPLLAPNLGGQLRRPAPLALLPVILPLADVAALTTACSLVTVFGGSASGRGVSGWAAGGYALAVLVHALRLPPGSEVDVSEDEIVQHVLWAEAIHL